MHLVLTEEPKQEIISLREAKNYLRVDHDFDDELITELIKTSRELMESVTEKSILKQTWQYVIEKGADENFNWVSTDTPNFSEYVMTIPLPRPPVIKIISVSIGDEILGSSQYRSENIGSKFYLYLSLRHRVNSGKRKSITIVYDAGMTDVPAKVPSQLKLANLMILANAYQERYSLSRNNLISQGIRQLLNPFMELRLF